MARARCNSSAVISPGCFTVSDSTQHSEVTSASSELVTGVRQKIVEWEDKKKELVTGKECFSFINSLNSELVVNLIKWYWLLIYTCTHHIVMYRQSLSIIVNLECIRECMHVAKFLMKYIYCLNLFCVKCIKTMPCKLSNGSGLCNLKSWAYCSVMQYSKKER